LTGFDYLGYRLQRKGYGRGQIMDKLLLGRTGDARDSTHTTTEQQGGAK